MSTIHRMGLVLGASLSFLEAFGNGTNEWQLLTCTHEDEAEGTKQYCVRRTINCNYDVSATALCGLNWYSNAGITAPWDPAQLGADGSCDGDHLASGVSLGMWGELGCKENTGGGSATASGGSGQSSASALRPDERLNDG